MKTIIFFSISLLFPFCKIQAQDSEEYCDFYNYVNEKFGSYSIAPNDSVLIEEESHGNRAYYTINPLGWSNDGSLFLLEDNSYMVGGYVLKFKKIQISSKAESELMEFEQNHELSQCETVSELQKITDEIISNGKVLVDSNRIGYVSQFGNNFFRYRGFNFSITHEKKCDLVEVYKYGADKILVKKYINKNLPPAWPGEQGCQSFIDLAGYFINPNNPMQIIIHVFEREGCGFENAESFNNMFIPINLNDFP